MNNIQWKDVKEILTQKGYNVTVVGRARKEYFAEKGEFILDFFKGGITGSGIRSEVFVHYGDDCKVLFHGEEVNLGKLLELADSVVNDYEEGLLVIES